MATDGRSDVVTIIDDEINEDLRRPRPRRKGGRAAAMGAGRGQASRAERDRLEADERAWAVADVGEITEHDLLLGGALIYMCEGARSTPWRRLDRLKFINDDPRLHRLFLRFLYLHGRGPDSLRYRVRIHETADAEAAADWWAERLEVPRELFERPTIKRHDPAGRRRSTTVEHHGCLLITVPRSRELYWRVEGVMEALDALR